MRIEALAVTNFLGVAHLALKPHGRCLLCGPNGSNKSSLLDAIRFALTGAPARGIRQKAHYRDMLRDGAPDGQVTITVGGKTATRGVKTGEIASGSLPLMPEALPYVLDAQRFAGLDVTARRAFLFGLVGLTTDHEAIARDLIERDIPQGYVDAIKPLLRAGFEGAAKHAETKATEARGAWRAITNETYGSVKAESWAPKDVPTAPDARALTDAEAELRTAAAKVASLDQRIGAARRDQQTKAVQTPPEKVAEWKERRAKGDAAQAEADAAVAAIKARDPSRTAGFTGPCPCCGEPITFTGQTFVKAAESTLPPAQYQVDLAVAEKHAREVREGIAKLDACLARAAAEATLSAPSPGEDLATLEAQRITAERDRLDKDLRFAQLRTQGEIAERAARAAGDALDQHRRVQTWARVAELLSPDGLPAERLARALQPVNDRMRRTAEVTGWPQVAIANDIEITVGGRGYALCSESEQWRSDMALADAIATVSGVRLLLLDRMDCLDIQSNRGAFLDWLDSVEADYDTVIVSATLKQPPEIVGVQVVWLGDAAVATRKVA